MKRLRTALFRLNCTLQDPDNWVGYCFDPVLTDHPAVWIRLGPHQFFMSVRVGFAYLKHWNQDECPACGRIHFPWCGVYGEPKIWP